MAAFPHGYSKKNDPPENSAASTGTASCEAVAHGNRPSGVRLAGWHCWLVQQCNVDRFIGLGRAKIKPRSADEEVSTQSNDFATARPSDRVSPLPTPYSSCSRYVHFRLRGDARKRPIVAPAATLHCWTSQQWHPTKQWHTIFDRRELLSRQLVEPLFQVAGDRSRGAVADRATV